MHDSCRAGNVNPRRAPAKAAPDEVYADVVRLTEPMLSKKKLTRQGCRHRATEFAVSQAFDRRMS